MRIGLTYANVASTVALVGVVGGGGAYAAAKIGTDDIQNRAVTAKKLDTDAVRASKIAAGAVTTESLDVNAAGVALAGAELRENGEIVSWFNRLGGQPEVEHAQTGQWYVSFPGLKQRDYPFVVTATVTGCSGCARPDAGIATARMSGVCSGTCSNQPIVNTYAADGTPKDLGVSFSAANPGGRA